MGDLASFHSSPYGLDYLIAQVFGRGFRTFIVPSGPKLMQEAVEALVETNPTFLVAAGTLKVALRPATLACCTEPP